MLDVYSSKFNIVRVMRWREAVQSSTFKVVEVFQEVGVAGEPCSDYFQGSMFNVG
jgi:hypothetical protein